MRLAILAAALVALAGCYAGNSLDIMREQNARGCVFARASANPLAAGGIVVIGTWGQDPPPYAECFAVIPTIP